MKSEENIEISLGYGILNSTPSDPGTTSICLFKRQHCGYQDLSQIFRLKTKDFSRQFAHIYAVRLNSMRDALIKRATYKWGKNVQVYRLAQLTEADGGRCVIIGTLFKHQDLKPSILKEISEESQLVPQPIRTHFVCDTDKLIMEDELQRIVLLSSLDVNLVVTGVVCAVLGCEDESGKFQVEDYCWAGVDSAPSSGLSPPDTDRFMLLVSGLELANNANLLSLQLLVDWLTGWLGDPQDQLKVAKFSRLIIAGNSIHNGVEKKETRVAKTSAIVNDSDTLTAVKLLDDFLYQLVQFIEVDLMAGEFDPTNHTLPQQPLHYCMFPKACAFKSLHGVPNPYSCNIEGRIVTGTSGQPVHDIARYSNLTDPLTILYQMLNWGHLAPTAPDTLPCYPFYHSDPFIMSCRPDVYFAGNQESFQTKLIDCDNGGGETHKVRLICVPSFNKTSTCAVINLATLDCYPVTFNLQQHCKETL